MHMDVTTPSASPDAWQLDVELDHAPMALDAECEPTPSAIAVEAETPPALTRIVEALLFASPWQLSAERICSFIRGLTPDVLEQTIQEMNLHYRQHGRPYAIVPHHGCYRLALRPRYQHHLEQLYGGVKEVRLSPVAVETLAIIAYRQPVSAAATEAILGQDCMPYIRQLIKRGMIQVKGQDLENHPLYVTTSRFLKFFSLSKVEDLPRADDMERL